MRVALALVALSLLVAAGCTTGSRGSTATGPSPAKDTYYVPPPKSLTTRATPSKEAAAGATAAPTAKAAKPVTAQ